MFRPSCSFMKTNGNTGEHDNILCDTDKKHLLVFLIFA